jgi:hypothetical protein
MSALSSSSSSSSDNINKRRALDYQDDDDEDDEQQQHAPKTRIPPSLQSRIRLTIIPVCDDFYFVNRTYRRLYIFALESMLNRILFNKTRGTELIRLDRSCQTDNPSGMYSQYSSYLQTLDALIVAEIQANDPADPNLKGWNLRSLVEQMQMRRSRSNVRVAPMLILSEITSNRIGEISRRYPSQELGNAFFPFAKLIYVVKHEKKETSQATDRIFTFDVPDMNPAYFEPTSHYNWEGTIYKNDLNGYIQRLAFSSPTALIVPESVVDNTDRNEIVSRKKSSIIQKQQQQYRPQMDEEYRDNAYVYPHQAETAEKVGMELISRAVVLDMCVGGEFVASDDLQGQLEHIVEWIMNYSEMINRLRLDTLNQLRSGEYTLFPSLNGIVDEYANGPMTYTTTTTRTEEEEEKKKS